VKTAKATVQNRVLVVEDHKPFLDFVSSSLRNYPNLQVIGEVEDGIVAVAQADALQPDLILLDIGLPGLNGIDVALRIRQLAPEAKIVFVTQESSDDFVQRAFSLGAVAYVLKANAGKDLPLALEAAFEGKKFASRGLDANGSSSPGLA
jgi:two-component system secretion response regulator SsrB